MKVITVANQKGGVAKTTISWHLSKFAASKGLRVLVADIDEGDLADAFPPREEDDKTAYLQASQLFTGKIGKRKPRQVEPNIHLIEADVAVLDVDDMPLDVIKRPRASLALIGKDFDLCVIDTPPNLQRRMLGALVASDAVVSPFDISTFSLARMPKLCATINTVQKEYNPSLVHLGFLPSKVNSRAVNEIEALPELHKVYGDLIFKEVIMSRACVGTAIAQGKAVWEGARSGNQRLAAKEMRQACEAIMSRMGF